jgi:hypothetical protein
MRSFIHITSALKVSELPTLELLKSTELSPKYSSLHLLEYNVRNEFKELVYKSQRGKALEDTEDRFGKA